MNIITQAFLWAHVPLPGGHSNVVRASDGYSIHINPESGALTVYKRGDDRAPVVTISSSAWMYIVSEPPIVLAPSPPPPPVPVEQETTKVWTKPKKKP